jgi:hypothetical protein
MKGIFCFALLLICLFGCEETTTQNQAAPGQSAQNPPPSPPPPYSPNAPSQNIAVPAKRILEMEIGSNLKDQDFQEETFDKLDSGLIESKVRALPWNDPNYYCQVTFTENLGDSEKIKVLDYLRIGGSLKATNEQDQVSAQMNESPNGELIILTCQNIQSVDQIVAMCLSFFQNDGKVKTMVKWVDPSERAKGN